MESRAANDLLRAIESGKLARPIGDPKLLALRDEILAADEAVAAAYRAAAAAVANGNRTLAHQLIARAADPLLREALAWQNRSALDNMIGRLAETAPDDDSSKARERKRVLVRYLQRYTLKNDTIGYFGPLCWAELDPEQSGVAFSPGPLVERRWAALEDWAVAAIAEGLTYVPELFELCTLRMKPFSWLEGNVLHRPPAEPIELDPLHAAELARGNGERVANVDIAKELVAKGLATAHIEIPAEVSTKAQYLRGLLERFPAHLAPFDKLLGELGALERAAGDADAVCAAASQLEATFTEITVRAAKRGHGQTYAGRQIFFEDCLRGSKLVVGRAVLDRIGEPLELVLASARWFTHEVAVRYRKAFAVTYAELARTHGAKVPLGAFLLATAPLFAHQKRGVSDLVVEVRDELCRRWDQVLKVDPGARHVELSSAAVRDQLLELFAAPGPGWPTARYHAPDLMLAAASVEELAAGNFTAVLGELHAGVNTLLARCAFDVHPERAAMLAVLDEELGPTATPVQAVADRTSTINWAPSAVHLELANARSWRTRDHVFIGGDLYIAEGLVVRSRTRELELDILQVMDHYISAEASPHFRLFRPLAHVPRVTLDRMVISRERWRFERTDFSMMIDDKRTREQQFLDVARWVRTKELPARVFAVVPTEVKPFYVDFTSPALVEMFLKFIAKAPTLALSELLPAFGEHWLTDDAGHHYTSELRLAAVDPMRWSRGCP